MLEIKGVKKSYGEFQLDCSLNVEKGRITGLVGENGAGKSTLFKAMLGLISYDGGEIKIMGKTPEQLGEKEKEELGVVLAEAGFSGYLKGKDVEAVLAKLYPKFEAEKFHLMCDRYLYHFFEGTYPYSFARGELYNYDPVTKDARSCGTTASLCGIEKGGFEGDLEQVKQGIQRVLMMHAACMSMEGFVMLSSGDEIGQVNDYNYKKNPDTAADSRYLHRSPFQWENAEKRKKPGTVQYAIWNGLKQMEEFRREENCFGETAGISTWDTGNSSVFAIRRTTGREELICLANFSEYGQNAWLNCLEGKYEDLFTGEKLEMNSVWMNPYQYRWCVKK